MAHYGTWRRSDPDDDEESIGEFSEVTRQKSSRKDAELQRRQVEFESDPESSLFRALDKNDRKGIKTRRVENGGGSVAAAAEEEDDDDDDIMITTVITKSRSAAAPIAQVDLGSQEKKVAIAPTPMMSKEELRKIVENGELFLTYDKAYDGYNVDHLVLVANHSEFYVHLNAVSPAAAAASMRARCKEFPVTVTLAMSGIKDLGVFIDVVPRIEAVEFRGVTVNFTTKSVKITRGRSPKSAIVTLNLALTWDLVHQCVGASAIFDPLHPASVKLRLCLSLHFSCGVHFDSFFTDYLTFTVAADPSSPCEFLIDRARVTDDILDCGQSEQRLVDYERSLQRKCIKGVINEASWPTTGRAPYTLFAVLIKALMSFELEAAQKIIRGEMHAGPQHETFGAVRDSSIKYSKDEAALVLSLFSGNMSGLSKIPYMTQPAAQMLTLIRATPDAQKVAAHYKERSTADQAAAERGWREQIPILLSTESSGVYQAFDKAIRAGSKMTMSEILRHRESRDTGTTPGTWASFMSGIFKTMKGLDRIDSALAHQLWRSYSMAVLYITCNEFIRRLAGTNGKIDRFIASDDVDETDRYTAELKREERDRAVAGMSNEERDAFMQEEYLRVMDEEGALRDLDDGGGHAPVVVSEHRLDTITRQMLELVLARLNVNSFKEGAGKRLSAAISSVAKLERWKNLSHVFVQCYLYMFAAIYRQMDTVHVAAMLLTPIPYINSDGSEERSVLFVHYMDIRTLIAEVEFGPCVPRTVMDSALFRRELADALMSSRPLGRCGLSDQQFKDLEAYCKTLSADSTEFKRDILRHARTTADFLTVKLFGRSTLGATPAAASTTRTVPKHRKKPAARRT